MFSAGKRVIWYRYSLDGVIISYGFGIVIKAKKNQMPEYNYTSYEILIDGGSIEIFQERDLELADWIYDS